MFDHTNEDNKHVDSARGGRHGWLLHRFCTFLLRPLFESPSEPWEVNPSKMPVVTKKDVQNVVQTFLALRWAPQMAQYWPWTIQKRPEILTSSDRLKKLQDDPQSESILGNPKMVRKPSQNAPGCPETAYDAQIPPERTSKCPQNSPETTHDRPKMSQDTLDPKTAPRSLTRASREL